ncbi:thioredoxin M5, chloroplastic-like [Rhagoletis pomonella]|uniref:thioredoxin M5, chloroplastic-like n=1 Tax=Rhagoletis pomonella TaxID=28610 RepID=UPI00177B1699|nr:thioredoxin M5, chloroplastic-like [Rhagoletis pomonella]
MLHPSMSSRPAPPNANAAITRSSAAPVPNVQATASPSQSTPVPASAAPPRVAGPNRNSTRVLPPAATVQSAPPTASPPQIVPAPATTGGTAPSAAASSPPVPATQVGPASASSQKTSPPPIPQPPIFIDGVNKLIIISECATYAQLLNEVGRKHLLVEFFAPWCGACMLINRKLEELANTYNGKLIIAKVNIDDCEQIAIDNDVSMMPSFLLMKENQILEKFAGSNEEKLINTIKKYVGEPTNGIEETNSLTAEPGI